MTIHQYLINTSFVVNLFCNRYCLMHFFYCIHVTKLYAKEETFHHCSTTHHTINFKQCNVILNPKLKLEAPITWTKLKVVNEYNMS